LILAGGFGFVGVVLLGEGTTGLMTLFSSGLFFDGEGLGTAIGWLEGVGLGGAA
jgi:hypothetical protein